MISTRLTKDTGHILENIVFNELARKSEVYYFSGLNECDFISIDSEKKPEVFQVCYDLNDQNRKREIDGLSEAMKYVNLKTGHILTMWQESEITIGDFQIRVIPVWKWIILKGENPD
jgi:predicted AAA+ superfamily ATPase